jgi:general secretion pathway protein C
MAAASTDKKGSWIIRAIIAVMAILLAFLIVRIVITFTNPESIWDSPKLAVNAPQSSALRGTQDFSFNTDPFNRTAPVSAEAVPDEGEDAPETTLQLTLMGRTTGPNGSAILRTPDNKQASYRLEEEILPGVTLQAVNKDFIVLNVDGQVQRLTFDRGAETGLIIKTAETNDAKPVISVKRNVSGAAPTSAPSSPTISADVSALFQNLSLRRVMKNGQLKGYSVKANRPGVDLSPYGFAKGDVITAIGGTDITRGRPDFLALFDQAAQSGGTEVTVLRNGQTRTITLGTP